VTRAELVEAAFIALQVRDHMREGRGAPLVSDMERFIEEAETVAELCKEANVRLAARRTVRPSKRSAKAS